MSPCATAPSAASALTVTSTGFATIKDALFCVCRSASAVPASISGFSGSVATFGVGRESSTRGDVFLRADFSDMGGFDQVGRALRGLVGKGRLMKIGQGLYARARRSPLDNMDFPPRSGGFVKEPKHLRRAD